MNIKCVDLTSYNFEELRELSDFLDIPNKEGMVKKKNGVTKMWLDIENSMVTIAYTQ
jgi:hypothetical protein